MSANLYIIASQIFIILVGVFSPFFLSKLDFLFFVEIAQVLAITNIIFNDGSEIARLRDNNTSKFNDLQILNFLITFFVVTLYLQNIPDIQYMSILLMIPFMQLVSKWIKLDLAAGHYKNLILENYFSWAMIKIIFVCLTFFAFQEYLHFLTFYIILYLTIFIFYYRDNLWVKFKRKTLASFLSLISLNTKIRTFSLSLDLIIVVGFVLSPDLAVTYVILRNLEIMFVSLFDQLVFKIVALREEFKMKYFLNLLPFLSILLLVIGAVVYYNPVLDIKEFHFYIYILQFFFLPAATAVLFLTTGKTMLANTRDGTRSLRERSYTYCIAAITLGSIALIYIVDWIMINYIPLIFMIRAGALILETRWWNAKHS